MSGSDDPYVSFGRCYFDSSGDEAPDRFIPCGNVNFGNVTCCQAEDMCLSSNACYNGETGMTYVAGCTDESYQDDSCPPKGPFADDGDAWVGITYCNGTSNEWALCDSNRSPTTVTTTNPCWCPESSRTLAFQDASVLANVVSLPSATGASLAWQGGFLPETESAAETGGGGAQSGSGSSPASTAAETTTSSTEINGTPTTTVITSTPTTGGSSAAGSSSDDSSSNSGLSTGAKVGIGIGVGLGVLALLALLIWAVLRRRRRHAAGSPSSQEKLTKPSPHHPEAQHPETAYPATHAAQQHGRFYDNAEAAPAAFGHKAELDASSTTATTTPSPRADKSGRPLSEIEGSPAQGANGRPLRDGGWEMPGQIGTIYEKPS